MILVLTGITLFLGALYLYDPLQVFHKHWNRENTLSGNMRQQVVGMLNNYDYDSIILGSSQLENTSSKEASSKLGGKFINISISGSDYYERSKVLEYVLEKKPIKKIIYSMDNLEKVRWGHPKYPIKTFDYLYDNNPLNDFKVYMNDKYVKCLITFSKKTRCIGYKLNLDRPKAWFNKKHHADRFGGLENWFKGKNSKQAINGYKNISNIAHNVKMNKKISGKQIDKKLLETKKYIYDYIIYYVEKYPTTEFILILPPYPRLKFAMDAQYNINNFKVYKEMILYIAKQSKTLDNLKLYGWGNRTFMDDIKNYKDTSHYSHHINSFMLDDIQKDTGLINNSNIKEYLSIITEKAIAFDLVDFGQRVDGYLKSIDYKK